MRLGALPIRQCRISFRISFCRAEKCPNRADPSRSQHVAVERAWSAVVVVWLLASGFGDLLCSSSLLIETQDPDTEVAVNSARCAAPAVFVL